MSAAETKRAPSGSRADLTIDPKGEVYLGMQMLLDERLTAPPATGFRFAVGLPEDGTIPPIEDPTLAANPGELPMQRLDYSFRATDVELCIKDRGLMMSYGVFGAPGSGKTHLMLYMLRQLFELEAKDEERKVGALILDPKAALIEDVEEMAAKAGRTDDLVVLNADRLAARGEAINIIDVDLEASELARALVLAAQSAGVSASEDYWFGAWENLFGAAIPVLQCTSPHILTLADLVDATLVVEQGDAIVGPERRIQRRAREAVLEGLSDDMRTDLEIAFDQLRTSYAQEPDNLATIENIITQSYGAFRRARTRVYCQRIPKSDSHTPFYDRIIDEGKIYLVSISPSDPGLAKVLCTLVKNLFMQSVRSRRDRVQAGRLQNFKRPVLIACDEYSQVASEIPGKVGDGDFFSIARQQGCMGIVASQSVNVLQATSLKEHWRSIFSNFGAKIFMRAVDNETVEEATKLAGESDWYVTSIGTSSGKDGAGSSTQTELRERKALPSSILTQLLRLGEGVIIGTLDGTAQPQTYFLTVPKN